MLFKPMVMQNHQASKNQDFKILLANFFTLYNPGLIAKYRLIMKQLLKQYAWILSICSALILLLLLTGCNQPPFTQGPILEQESNTHIDSTQERESNIPNFNGIAHALGCVFAPDSCNKQ